MAVRLAQLAQQRVGREGEGVGQQDRPGRALELGEARDDEAAVGGLGRGVERRGHAAVERGGPDGDGGAALDLATVAEDAAGAAADQRGRREAVVDGGERRLGILEMLSGGEDDGDVGRLAHEAGLGRTCRLERALERSVSVRYTGADADGHRSTILRAMPPSGTRRDPPLPIVALFGPTGVGKTAVGAAVADWLRFRGEDPVAISADALQVYAGLETLTGAAPAAVRAAPRAPPRVLPARRRDVLGRAVRAARARRDRRRPGRGPPADRDRRHRAVPARGARRRWRCDRRPCPGVRERLEAELEQRGPEAHARDARPRRPVDGGHDRPARPPPRRPRARAPRGRRARPARRARTGCGPTRSATRPCSSA